MSMPIGWMAEDWEKRKHTLWKARNADAETIARRDFIIAEHVRTGSIVDLENEYGMGESELHLWINGRNKYDNDGRKWFMCKGGQDALRKLNEAFKEAKK